MKKIILTTLAITLLFSFGCSNKPKTIEEQAKAEVQKVFDAIDDGKILSYTYKSDVLEDREFLDQMINIAAKNLDEDIYNQGAKTLRSLCEVADKQAENIALNLLLMNLDTNLLPMDLDTKDREDKDIRAKLEKEAKENAKQIKQIAAIISKLTHTEYETLHKHNAFEQIISKIDKPTSELIHSFLTKNCNLKSAKSFNYIKMDETTVKIEFTESSDIYDALGFLHLTLKKNGEKWELFDHNNEQIIFKVDQKIKEESFKEIASSLYFESVSPEGQIEKARKIQMLTLFEQSLAPLKEEMTYDDFELSLSQLMTFIFSAMSSI